MEKPQLHPIYGTWAEDSSIQSWALIAVGCAFAVVAACLLYFLFKKWKKSPIPMISPQVLCIQRLEALSAEVDTLSAVDCLQKIDNYLHDYLLATQPKLSPGWTLDDLPEAVATETQEILEPILKDIQTYRFSAATPDLATRQNLLAQAMQFVEHNNTSQPL